MNILIGDIGNTVTKICLVKKNKFIIKKKIFFTGKQILSKKILKKRLIYLLKNKPVSHIALFSSVVPKYEKIIRRFLKRKYQINLIEIKDKKIKKIIKLNISNQKQVG